MKGRNPDKRSTYVGKILTKKRLKAGISQMNLAYLSEMAPVVYQRIETGKNEFADTRMKYGLAICAILGIDPYMIVFQQDSESLKKQLLE